MASSRLGKIFGVLPGKERQLALVMEDVLSKPECETLLRRAEHVGYEPALVNIGGGREIKKTDVRNSDRCIIDDATITKDWWDRIVERLDLNVTCEEEKRRLALDRLFIRRPSDGRVRRAAGLNERVRILRYIDGHYIKPPLYGSYKHSHTFKSFTTSPLIL